MSDALKTYSERAPFDACRAQNQICRSSGALPDRDLKSVLREPLSDQCDDDLSEDDGYHQQGAAGEVALGARDGRRQERQVRQIGDAYEREQVSATPIDPRTEDSRPTAAGLTNHGLTVPLQVADTSDSVQQGTTGPRQGNKSHLL